jgi:hypothetical protein
MDNLRETAVELLKEYAVEQGTIVRSTSDLSPLEEWLLVKLANYYLTFAIDKV